MAGADAFTISIVRALNGFGIIELLSWGELVGYER
jgi:hypothetical protein